MPDGNIHGTQNRFCHESSLRLLGIFLTEGTPQRNEHEKRNFVEESERHDGVDGGQKAVILHEESRVHPCEMCSG